MKSALVTGSSSGIGKSIAMQLASDGYHIFCHYRGNKEGAESILGQIQETGGSGQLLQFDLMDGESIEAAVKPVLANKELHLEVLVNNAGFHKDSFFVLQRKNDIQSVVQANLIGPMILTQLVAKKMLRQRSGSIVNISSLAGQMGNIGQANYAASKAGLIAFTKSLSMELGPRGIRVNCVAPGLIETSMIDDIPHKDLLIQQTPLRRVGTTEEVADVVSYLCSKKASFITGATLSVNGGIAPI